MYQNENHLDEVDDGRVEMCRHFF